MPATVSLMVAGPEGDPGYPLFNRAAHEGLPTERLRAEPDDAQMFIADLGAIIARPCQRAGGPESALTLGMASKQPVENTLPALPQRSNASSLLRVNMITAPLSDILQALIRARPTGA